MHTLHELYSIPHWQIIAGSILAVRLLNLPLLGLLIGGGIVIGLLAETLHRRWS